MIITVLGKGGVGKSLVSSLLFDFFSKSYKTIGLDCDVDNPSLHVWLGIRKWEKEIPLYLSEKAYFENKVPDEICPFGAIRNGKLIESLCHGCGLCALKYKNVKFVKRLTGWIRIYKNIISGKLVPGETGSGKIVDELKREADKYNWEIQVRDASAGIGCSVISSIQGSDYGLIVVEPTPSSINAMNRIKNVLNHFGVRYFVLINKWNLNPDLTKQIEKKERVVGKIPYEKSVFKALTNMELPKLSRDWIFSFIEKIGYSLK